MCQRDTGSDYSPRLTHSAHDFVQQKFPRNCSREVSTLSFELDPGNKNGELASSTSLYKHLEDEVHAFNADFPSGA